MVIKDFYYFESTLRPEWGPESGSESGPESGPESILARIMGALRAGPRSKSELATALGHKSVSGKLNARVREMLAEGLIEYTIPNKPNSRLQKYRLTEKGKEFVMGDG